MGTEERCGRGEPQRTQVVGKRAQPKASMGLRSTRATERQREVSDGGTPNVSKPESLRKTCLPCVGATGCAPPWRQYTRTAPEIPWLLAQLRRRHGLSILIFRTPHPLRSLQRMEDKETFRFQEGAASFAPAKKQKREGPWRLTDGKTSPPEPWQFLNRRTKLCCHKPIAAHRVCCRALARSR